MSNRLEPHMNRTLLLIALAAAVPARAADEFKPIKASESVTYPLPPIPLPAAQPRVGEARPGGGRGAQRSDPEALPGLEERSRQGRNARPHRPGRPREVPRRVQEGPRPGALHL